MTNISLVDICNNAMSEFGHDVVITSLSDTTSAEAVKCARLLPVARLAVFSAGHPWSFLLRNPDASARVLANVAPLPGYDAVYAVPADAIMFVGAFDGADCALSHLASGGYVHVMGCAATLRYTRMVEQSERWNVAGVLAVQAELAYRLARIMKAGPKELESLRVDAARQLSSSKSLDSVSSRRNIGTATRRNPYVARRR